MIRYSEELLRKLIHLSSLWIPILYLHSTTALMLRILLPLTIAALIIDLGRKYSKKLNALINKIIGNLMRDEEKNAHNLAGATHLFMACTLTIAFFEKEIAIFALTVLVISDCLSALIGRRFGKIKIMDKTLEGSVSFAISAILIYYYYVIYHNFDFLFTQAMLAVFAATIAELYAKKLRLDDNFAIPLTICLILVF